MCKKTVVITGASRGIGRAIAEKYALAGYNLALCCHNNIDKLEDFTKYLSDKYSVRCIAYQCDIGNFHNASAFFELIRDNFNTVDILINNAGISTVKLLQDMTPEEWNNIVNVNLGSVFNCCKLAIPMMLVPKSGKIINISSVWGCTGASTEVAYSATKGAVNAFTMALAKELAPSNIQVNAVACGIIDTDMNNFLNKDELMAIRDEIPAGRLGTPDEVAEFVFNITNGNNYLTGQIIKFDGGWI